MSYKILGTDIGNYILLITLVVDCVVIFISFKSGLWDKFALNKKNQSKVNVIETEELILDQEGICLSDMKPIGNIQVNDKRYEASTRGEFLDSGTKIKVIKFNHHKIIVEQINN